MGPLVAQHRRELQDMGWTVRLVPGERHDMFAKVDVVSDVLEQFLGRLSLSTMT